MGMKATVISAWWTRSIVAVAVLVALFAAAGHRVVGVSAQQAPIIAVPFNAQVLTGNAAGMVVNGMLNFQVNSKGEFDGQLNTDDGSQFVVRGNTTGTTVSISIGLPNNSFMFGSGAATRPISEFQAGDMGAGQLVVVDRDGNESTGVWLLRCTSVRAQLCAL
jgi:hypothetical protein